MIIIQFLSEEKMTITFDVSLHQSVKAGDNFEVSVLLQLGANPNNKDEEGKYPVETAREGGHDKVILTLLTGGAIDSKLFNHIHGYGHVINHTQ